MGRRVRKEVRIHCKCRGCGYRCEVTEQEVGYLMICPECHLNSFRPVQRITAPPMELNTERNIFGGLMLLFIVGGLMLLVARLVPENLASAMMMARLVGIGILAVFGILIGVFTVFWYMREDARDNRGAAANERRRQRRDHRRPKRRYD